MTLPALEGDENGVAVRVLRGRLDLRDRPLHRLRDAGLPALADGRRVRARPVDAGRKYKWINPAAIIWVAICVIIFCLPFTPAAVPWRDEFDWRYVNYAPITVGGAAADRRPVVDGQRQAHVQGPGAHGRVRRGRRDPGVSRPVIGLCAAVERARWSVWDDEAVLLPRSYATAVSRAGGLPVLLPPEEEVDAGEWLDLLDGLILAGGADYGEVPDRDAFEIALALEAMDARPAAARRLPRDAADEPRARRDADRAPARRARPRGPPARAGRVRRPRRAAGRGLAGRARRG